MSTPTTQEWLGTLNALAKTVGNGAAAAACILAGIPVGSMDVLGALNIKAGNGRAPSGWRNLAGVCNQLAGTTNLEPLLALQLYLAAGGGGGGDAMQLITSSVLGSDTATISLSAIPGTFNVLKLIAVLRTSRANAVDSVTFTVNADAGAHYDVEALSTSGSGPNTAGSLVQSGGTSFASSLNDTAGNNATAGVAGLLIAEFPLYAGTTFQKRVLFETLMTDAVTSANDSALTLCNGLWRSTAAITSITLAPGTGPNFKAGSSAFLYGY